MLSVKTGSTGCNAYIIFLCSDPMQLMGSREDPAKIRWSSRRLQDMS